MSPRRFLTPAATLLWLVYALFFVAGVAQAAIVPLLPRLSGHFHLAATETALLLALPGLATLAVSVPSGLAADRFGARRVSLAAGILLSLSSLAQATPSLAALLVGRVAFGIAYGVVWTTGMAWLSDMDGAGGGSRLGASVTCSSVGIMAGPAIAGLLAQHLGLAAPFLAIAAAAAAVVAPLALTGGGSSRPPRSAPASAGSLSPRAMRALLRRPGVAAAAGALIVSGAVSGVSQLLISGGLHHAGLSTGRIGLAFSAAAVCYILVSAGVVRLGARAQTLRFNAAATALLALGLVPALGGAGAAGLIGALLLTAAPRAAVSTIAYSLASDPDPQARGGEGLVFGMLNGGWAAATVLMPLLAGALEQHDGASAGYLGVIVPSLAIALWLLVRAAPQTVAPAGTRTRRVAQARVRGAQERARVVHAQVRGAHQRARVAHGRWAEARLAHHGRRRRQRPVAARGPYIVGPPPGAHHRERDRAFAHAGVRQIL